MKNNNENKILNVPNLRFPEFSGEWENCQIANILSIGSGRDYKHLEKGNIPVFGTGGYMTSVNECIYDGETTFIGRKGSINKPFYYNGKFWTVDTLFYTHSFNKTTPKFVYCLFQTINWLRYNEASGVPSLSKDTIEKIKVFIPQLDEQRKISEMLSVIDERIATQNKIIEKLQSLIRGLAVTLTTKGNFNTAISQCLECHSSTLQESEVLPNGLYKVFGANGLVGYTDVPQMNGDAILVIKDGSGVGTVSYAQGKFSAIGTLNYLTVIDNNDLRYLYFALSVFNFQAYKTGMAIPHIYFKDYGKAKIYCPPLAEQKHIANVLDKLESKLLLEQGILASFNWQKRYLLGQMLI
ncbi:restriction endonuclease subunit S [Bacteroides thetaiotaomicron]|uniref:restriction endonuclease subunit S n=1 Tax=Bacteroidales TaxID=171549 RepID=UPI001F405717|nr:restriction endonuclease subunit S [Bacteroides thetaiotaomicron]MCE9368734.1 restriction endonuclease subunit S [Bacteroides thetaiotaomicron]MCG5009478.1 restriction endonuclease subunit S [Bacteroides thetaiotaomicron]UVP26805.1 restriction endonuclease subunit S [Bacteroides thetaiotaomicron]